MTPGESHNEWYQYYCSNICLFKFILVMCGDYLVKTIKASVKELTYEGMTEVDLLVTSFTQHGVDVIC